MIKIVSGGQTGVDRAALDVALELGLPCGGWCPKGRRAEDGTIPEHYPLQETATDAYPERTELNVRDSDATLVLTRGKPDRGTALTVKLARRLRKPCRIIDLATPEATQAIRTWLIAHEVKTLNVAGPRESSQPGIRQEAESFLRSVLAR